ncbi:hypothetical protein SNE40_009044 [Patella caerulea]|uniref:U3 small nucleolar RNA-associated protein 25 homolog n=1 Tax=Patella caerulea TaxID=87958 RepID=A0AAN8JVQ7_PATCE
MAPKKRHGKVVKKQRRKINLHALSYQQKQHLKEFGEVHPSESREDEVKKYRHVKDESEFIRPETDKVKESSDSEGEITEHPFQELLSTIDGRENDSHVYESSNDEEDDMEEEAGDEIEEEEEDIESDDEDVDDQSDDEDGQSDGEVKEEVDDGEQVEEDDGIANAEENNKQEVSQQEIFPEIEDIEVDDKEIIDINDDKTDYHVQDSDPFTNEFDKEVDEVTINKVNSRKEWTKQQIKIPGLGKGNLQFPCQQHLPPMNHSETDLSKLYVKENLLEKIPETNEKLCNIQTEGLSPLQQGIFNVLNDYQDLYYTERSHHNQEEVRLSYCLHALNHVVKSRNRVIGNNTKLKDKKASVDDDYRDQGLTRPKVLIMVPFRESAYKIVEIFISLMSRGKKAKMMNRKRFVQEYHDEDEEDTKKVKPEDFDALFAGNIDDHFRFGVQVCKSVIKLYSHFYLSDLIIASPLGLRTIIGAEGEKGDHDFLSSIELLILDQTDVFLMQNWDHLTQIINKMHQQPKTGHGVDFSRVRMWTLEGWSKYYRQTAIFSSISSPEITALFNKHYYRGKIQIVRKPSSGTICQIVTQLPQTFHRFSCKNFSEICEDRFHFFVKKVLPDIQEHMKNHTMVFIPSYFDFVRIRNYFAKEEMNFVQMNEYVKDQKVSKYRWLFFVGKVPFMLYTERLHFYRRYKIRGIHHVVFYELPHYPHYYSEVCNMLKDPKRNLDHIELSCTVLYSKYDAQKLSEIVGVNRTSVMINSDKTVHMFVTGENS